jgi:hypothetical protein
MKIRELQQVIGAGSRSNKYQVLFPYLGYELDIQCHDIQTPGRSIGTTDVYLKGREFKIAGDRADQGTITMTFYNDPMLLLRRFFLKIIGGIQNYQTPQSIEDSMFALSSIGMSANDLNTYLLGGSGSESSGPESSGVIDFLEGVSDTVLTINDAYYQIKDNVNSLGTIYNSFKGTESIDINIQEGNSSITPVSSGYGFYVGKPWYMTDIKILQLGPDEENLVESTLHNAFVSDISPIEYTDETGDVTQTTVTITYSGIDYGNDREVRFLERY